MNTSNNPASPQPSDPPESPTPTPSVPPPVDLHTDDLSTPGATSPSVAPEVPGADAMPDPGTDPAASPAPTIGHIGRYALKQRLGEGGLGTVYAAYDPILSRTIAVKTLHLSAVEGDRAALDALFLNEARAAAGLNHPNIVTVYDAGLSEQGVYIAMERLRGRDLRQLLANGWKPDIVQAVQIVRRVADALSYAHARGVIHCDIKPANIFMVGRTLPKVVDFGIARVAHGQAIPALEGMVAGSPHYLAPEQLRGETVDRRCDVYALGVVMYELLTHRKAFNGGTLAEIVDAVQGVDPPPVHELRRAVPASLSAIVHQAMAREPSQRYRSARQFARDLRQWLEAEGDLITDEPPPIRPWQRPLVATLGTIVLAAAAASWWWWQEPLPLAMTSSEPPRAATAPVAAAPTTTAQVLPPLPAGSLAPGATAPSAADANANVDKPAATPTASAKSDAARGEPTRTVARAGAPTRPSPRPTIDGAARERGTPRTAAKPAATVVAAAPAQGTLQLAISPWGRIEVDGAAVGVTPPLARLSLPVGEHVVTVRNEDYPPFTTTVRIIADEPAVVRHRFGS